MKCVAFVLCVTLLPSILCDCRKPNVRTNAGGYYWRDYHGEIPDDAIKGSVDAHGKVLYIGQTLKEKPYGSLIVGHINPSEKKLLYAYEGNLYHVKENVKILCSPHPENFYWISSNFTNLRESHLSDLVVGGYDTYPLYIGRTKDDTGGEIVGKLTLDSQWESFAYVYDGKAIFVKSAFDALAYRSPKGQDIDGSNCDSKVVNINVFY